MTYVWKNPRNAVGFAAACGREALPFYDGTQRHLLVEAIEIAEAYSRGEGIVGAEVMARRAYDANIGHTRAAFDAIGAAGDAAATVAAIAGTTGFFATADGANAVHAGVPQHIIDRLHYRWIVRDLGGDPDTEIGYAMFALVARNAYVEAAQIAQENAA